MKYKDNLESYLKGRDYAFNLVLDLIQEGYENHEVISWIEYEMNPSLSKKIKDKAIALFKNNFESNINETNNSKNRLY